MMLKQVESLLGGILSCLLLVAASGYAQDEDPPPSPQKEGPSAKQAGDDRFSWSIGPGLVASPRPYIDAKTRVYPMPALTIRYKRFFIEGIRAGYEIIQTDRFTTSIFSRLVFLGLEPEESPFLEGMAPRGQSIDGGLELLYRGRPVALRVGLFQDILGRSNGQEVSFEAITGAPLGGLILLVGFGPRWLSQSRVDYYYGVRREETRPDRPMYLGKATWNLDLNVTTIWDFSSKWSFQASLTRESLGAGIKNSPVLERDTTYSLLSSLTYAF